MATKNWIGGAAATPMVDSVTPGGTIQVDDIFTITLTGEDESTASVSFTATTTTVAHVCAGLVAAAAASTSPLFTAITWTDLTTSVRATAKVPGVPFALTTSTTDGGGAATETLTRAAVTANTGGSDFSTAVNWSDGVVPANSGDTVVFDGRAVAPLLHNLAQSGKTLTALTVYRSCRHSIGTSSSALRISATTLKINVDPMDGSSSPGPSIVNIDTGANASTQEVHGSPTVGPGGVQPVIVNGASITALRVYGGTCGVATSRPGQTAVVTLISIRGRSAKCVIGDGVSVTNVTVYETGSLEHRGAIASTLTQKGGTVRTEGAGTIATWKCNGKGIINATGQISNLNIDSNGDIDTTETVLTRTISNSTLVGEGRVLSDSNTTWSTGVAYSKGARSIQIDFGLERTVTPS